MFARGLLNACEKKEDLPEYTAGAMFAIGASGLSSLLITGIVVDGALRGGVETDNRTGYENLYRQRKSVRRGRVVRSNKSR